PLLPHIRVRARRAHMRALRRAARPCVPPLMTPIADELSREKLRSDTRTLGHGSHATVPLAMDTPLLYASGPPLWPSWSWPATRPGCHLHAPPPPQPRAPCPPARLPLAVRAA